MASIRDLGLVPVYDRVGAGTGVPDDYDPFAATHDVGQIDPQVLSMLTQQAEQRPSGLTSRSVRTYAVDMDGNPIIGGNDAVAAAVEARGAGGARPAITVGSQPAGTVQMPAGARPSSVDRAFAQMGMQPGVMAPVPRQRPNFPSTVWDPFGTSSVAKDETRLPANDGGESGFLTTYYPEAQNPAGAAIDQATAGVPLPRNRPIPQATIPLTAVAPSQPRQLEPITFRRGDTVSALAQARGMTTNEFAAHYGITDPNRIFAGQTVSPRGGSAAATAPAVPSRAPQQPAPSTPLVRNNTPASEGGGTAFTTTNSGQTIRAGQTVNLSGGRTGVVQSDGSIIDNNGRTSRGSRL